MTAQIGDRIYIENKEYTLACEPLSRFLYDNKIKKLFRTASTACFRGYWATWKLEDSKIYLLDVEAPRPLSRKKQNESKEPIPAMQKLFPGQTNVFAYWVNDFYESIYETDIFLKFENGILIDEEIISNKPKE